MTIRNSNYALTRLIGLLVAVCTLGGLAWLAVAVSDAQWYVKGFCFAVPVTLVAVAGHAVTGAAWWVELGAEGVRVRYLHRHRTYRWRQIREVKLGTVIVYVYRTLTGTIKIPFRRYPALILVPSRGRKITVLLNQRERSALEKALGPLDDESKEKTCSGRGTEWTPPGG